MDVMKQHVTKIDVTRAARGWLAGPHRWRIIGSAAAALAVVVVWGLVQAGWLLAATGLAGVTGMAVACSA